MALDHVWVQEVQLSQASWRTNINLQPTLTLWSSVISTLYRWCWSLTFTSGPNNKLLLAVKVLSCHFRIGWMKSFSRYSQPTSVCHYIQVVSFHWDPYVFIPTAAAGVDLGRAYSSFLLGCCCASAAAAAAQLPSLDRLLEQRCIIAALVGVYETSTPHWSVQSLWKLT